MDEDTKASIAIASVAFLFFAGLFATLLLALHASHAENMACIQSGRSIVQGSCVKLAGDTDAIR